MKKAIWIVMGLVAVSVTIGTISLFMSCSGLDLGDGGTVYVSSSSGGGGSSSGTSSSGGSLADIQKVYCQRATGTQISMDPSWEVWPGTGDSVTFTAVYSGTYEGGEAIQCSKSVQTWMGFVIKSQVSGGVYANLDGYTTLNFALKATTDFPLDVQVGCGQAGTAYQKWYDISLIKDNNWHAYSVMITNIATSIMTNMQWLFAMRSTNGNWSTAASSLIYFDDVYYSKTN